MTITTPGTTSDALDVWLRILGDDEEAEAEANTYMTETGFVVEWYINSVGLVKAAHFDTLADAYDWLQAEGFADYTTN